MKTSSVLHPSYPISIQPKYIIGLDSEIGVSLVRPQSHPITTIITIAIVSNGREGGDTMRWLLPLIPTCTDKVKIIIIIIIIIKYKGGWRVGEGVQRVVWVLGCSCCCCRFVCPVLPILLPLLSLRLPTSLLLLTPPAASDPTLLLLPTPPHPDPLSTAHTRPRSHQSHCSWCLFFPRSCWPVHTRSYSYRCGRVGGIRDTQGLLSHSCRYSRSTATCTNHSFHRYTTRVSLEHPRFLDCTHPHGD